jgi:hypothetical protein
MSGRVALVASVCVSYRVVAIGAFFSMWVVRLAATGVSGHFLVSCCGSVLC